MKKSFFLFPAIAMLLFSCVNPHFNMDTSVSVYLPEVGEELSSAARANTGATPDEFSGRFWDISLSQNDIVIYSLSATGGSTAIFSSIVPGSYIITCNLVEKRITQKTIIYGTSQKIIVKPGQNNVIDINVPLVPRIVQQPESDFVQGTNTRLILTLDRISSGVPLNDYGEFNVKDSSDTNDPFYTMNVSDYVQWYCNNSPLPWVFNSDLPLDERDDKYNTQIPEGATFVKTFSITSEDFNGKAWVSYDFYAILKNPKTGGQTRTNTITIYFVKSDIPSIKDYIVQYKGNSNVIDIKDYRKLSSEDFSAIVNYKADNDEVITINYSEVPSKITLPLFLSSALGEQNLSFKVYQNFEALEAFVDFMVVWNFEPPEAIGSKLQTSSNILSVDLDNAYIFPYVPDAIENSIPSTYQWYRYFPETGKKEMLEGSTNPSLDYNCPIGTNKSDMFYFICEINYNVGQYCINANNGNYYKMDSRVYEVEYTGQLIR